MTHLYDDNVSAEDITQIEITLDKALLENDATRFSQFFDELGYSLTLRRNLDNDMWEILILSPKNDMLHNQVSSLIAHALKETGLDIAPLFTVAELPQIDWLEHVYQQFKPIEVEGFYIYGSHIEQTTIPKGLTPIEINAANAFGTGEHPTTKGCLQAMGWLKETQKLIPKTALDLGCGSAILSIAAAKIWPECTIIATDMDADSVDVAIEYAGINNVADAIHCETATGYDANLIREYAPFPFILANILAAPLIEMAAETAAHIAPNGYVVLSGTLIEQEDAVREAHEKHGLKFIKSFHIDEWTSFIMQKPA